MLLRIFKYDFKNYFIKRSWRLLIGMFITFTILIYAYLRMHNKIVLETFYNTVAPRLNEYTFADCCVIFFGGGTGAGFIVLLNAFLLYFVLHYPFNDLHGYGRQVLVLSRSRQNWWYSKCMTNAVWAVAYFLVSIIVIFIFCLFNGIQISLSVTGAGAEFGRSIIEDLGNRNYPLRSIITVVFVMPILVSITVTVFQLFLSIFIKPIYSYIISVLLVYIGEGNIIFNYLFVSCYAVPYNNSLFAGETGLSTTVGVIYCLVLILISVFGGSLIFKKYDILQ